MSASFTLTLTYRNKYEHYLKNTYFDVSENRDPTFYYAQILHSKKSI